MRIRFVKILSIIIIALILTACKNKSDNKVLPKDLSKEQEEIVKLLSIDGQEILLFDYKTSEGYKNIKLWVEIYKDGNLVESLAGVEILNIEEKQLDGQFVVTINQNPSFEWSFSIICDEQGYSNNTVEYEKVDSGMSRIYGAIDYPASIEDGKEIVLYTSFFSNGNISVNVDRQIYVDKPELLSEYKYAHIIKCKFTKP
jgi:hypothetical protein